MMYWRFDLLTGRCLREGFVVMVGVARHFVLLATLLRSMLSMTDYYWPLSFAQIP